MSSVSHLGFVVLGIFAFHAISIQGAIFQMLSHGISTGALFLGVGMLYDRRHTHLIKEFGGPGDSDAGALARSTCLRALLPQACPC